MSSQFEPVEFFGHRPWPGRFLFTCEHASNRIPAPLTATAEDAPWLETHWAVDIGAAAVTRELARLTESAAILSNFSRLVCDANRSLESPTLIWEAIDGYQPSFNRVLTDAERERRVTEYYEPYHRAVDGALAAAAGWGQPPILVAVHSFTPVYRDEARHLEVGVLFDRYEPEAVRLAEEVNGQGWAVALNEPYSGRAGMMYSVHTHGERHGVIYLELELRQDLIADESAALKMAQRLAPLLSKTLTP